MFFADENFSNLPNKQDRTVAADTANEVIKERGTALFGRFLKDGTAIDFTTEKKPEDSHVCIAVGMTEMRAFAPSASYVKTGAVKERDRLLAQQRLIDQLTLENKNLREVRRG